MKPQWNTNIPKSQTSIGLFVFSFLLGLTFFLSNLSYGADCVSCRGGAAAAPSCSDGSCSSSPTPSFTALTTSTMPTLDLERQGFSSSSPLGPTYNAQTSKTEPSETDGDAEAPAAGKETSADLKTKNDESKDPKNKPFNEGAYGQLNQEAIDNFKKACNGNDGCELYYDVLAAVAKQDPLESILKSDKEAESLFNYIRNSPNGPELYNALRDRTGTGENTAPTGGNQKLSAVAKKIGGKNGPKLAALFGDNKEMRNKMLMTFAAHQETRDSALAKMNEKLKEKALAKANAKKGDSTGGGGGGGGGSGGSGSESAQNEMQECFNPENPMQPIYVEKGQACPAPKEAKNEGGKGGGGGSGGGGSGNEGRHDDGKEDLEKMQKLSDEFAKASEESTKEFTKRIQEIAKSLKRDDNRRIEVPEAFDANVGIEATQKAVESTIAISEAAREQIINSTPLPNNLSKTQVTANRTNSGAYNTQGIAAQIKEFVAVKEAAPTNQDINLSGLTNSNQTIRPNEALGLFAPREISSEQSETQTTSRPTYKPKKASTQIFEPNRPRRLPKSKRRH